MNGLSVSGEKADQNLQTEIETKLEVKIYKLWFLCLSVRQDQTFTWDF